MGPLRVSVMFDANGANTTAAAAVLVASQRIQLRGTRALVLAATGPVGQRVVRLLAREGADVRAASRDEKRAAEVRQRVLDLVPDAQIAATAVSSQDQLRSALDGVQLVIAAGAAGIQLLPAADRLAATDLRVAIDLNAVPPLGIEGVGVMDQATMHDGVCCYGAIGVGGTKMKIHKAAVRKLFEANDQILDAEQIFAIGQSLV
jgi:NADPH:quinone reductase-like Zn-dependent oxidoreductase